MLEHAIDETGSIHVEVIPRPQLEDEGLRHLPLGPPPKCTACFRRHPSNEVLGQSAAQARACAFRATVAAGVPGAHKGHH